MSMPRLSTAAERVMAAAAEESGRLGHGHLGVEHIFLAVSDETGTRISEALSAQGCEFDPFAEKLRAQIGEPGTEEREGLPAYTRRTAEVLHLAGKIAERQGEALVQPWHILDAILSEGRSVPVRLLRTGGIDVVELQYALSAPVKAPADASTPLLSRFGRDLTELARSGRLSPLIGRNEELEQIEQVLLRRNKNNPVLVGEAGVGKSAVVEGLAQRLTEPECAEPFRGRRIVELSVGSLVAGTKYRGEFEDRLLGIIAELTAHPEIILFVDEIHTLVGAGASGGDSLDASNIIKPALARGEICCIGATTIDEYRRYVEKDPALDRRFQKVQVDEPTPRDTVEILTQLRPLLEVHHKVRIAPEAVEAAVDLTVRHVADRQLPDKALDALDQTCARERLAALGSGNESGASIGEQHVIRTVSQWTGIPLERATPEAAADLLGLHEELAEHVIGQDHATRAVAEAVVTARVGLAREKRPLGVFLFLGPTGVGKTELAKSLAGVLFGDRSRLVRFDMSEFGEPHSIARLIGAPPGYVGYEREGLLISALRTRPHCVVLFDEIEKAHPKVFDLFLQIFDDGRLSGAHGRTADFSQALILMTSNLSPVPPAPDRPTLGFVRNDRPVAAPAAEPNAHELRNALTGFLRPELVNRIDEILLFHALGPADLRRIVDRFVAEIEEALASRRFALRLEEEVYDYLLAIGQTEQFGARELRRVVDKQIRQPLARAILARESDPGEIRVSVADGRLIFR